MLLPSLVSLYPKRLTVTHSGGFEALFIRVHGSGILRSSALILSEALQTLNGPDIVRGYASFGTSEKGEMALEEDALTGLALYLWVVFVLWATRCGWE
jgi:hypothetical protein